MFVILTWEIQLEDDAWDHFENDPPPPPTLGIHKVKYRKGGTVVFLLATLHERGDYLVFSSDVDPKPLTVVVQIKLWNICTVSVWPRLIYYTYNDIVYK